MPNRLMLILLVLCLTPRAPAWGQSNNIRGWASDDQWERVVETAQEKGRPIVAVMYQFGLSGAADETALAWASHRAFRGMVPIHMKSRKDHPQFHEATGVINDSYDYGPKLYIFDEKLRLVGYRNYRHKDRLNEALAVAGELLTWLSEAEKKLTRADQVAEAGRIGPASALLDEVAEQDIRSTHALQLLAVSAKEGETPERPDPPRVGAFFQEEIEAKRQAHAELANQRITEATHLYQDLKYREALALLRPLTSDRSDAPHVEQAKKLAERINESMVESQKQKAK